jgi:site-specific DNA recombinase
LIRAAIYARVSTEEQAEKFGLTSQVTELRVLAAQRGYAVPHGGEYVDDGYTGADMERPALSRLREAVRTGIYEVILVHDPDRLSRRLAHQLLLEEEFKGAVAEYERLKIRERTMRGKREKARQGLVVAGPVPYGYRPDPAAPGRLQIDDDEASVVRMVYGWLIEEQRSIREITTELRRLGIQPRRGRAWAPSSVRRILTSELYAGRAFFNRRERVTSSRTGRKGTSRRFRPETEWIGLEVPHIVADDLYRQAQTQLARNKARLGGRPPIRFYLLRGLVRCADCGRKYVGIPSHGRRVYRCAGRDRLAGSERCRSKTVSAERLERQVWNATVAVLRQPALLMDKLEVHRARAGAPAVEVRSEVDHLTKQLAEVERREVRLLDLYLEDDLQVPALKARLEDLRRAKAGISERLARAQARIAAHEAAGARHDAIRRFCRQARRGLTRLTPEGQRRLLGALVDQIVMRPEAVEIHGILPTQAPPPRGDRSRSDSQHVVRAGGGDLEAALGVRLAPHVGEIEAVTLARPGGPACAGGRADLPLAVQVLDGIVEGADGDHVDPRHHGGLGGIGRGHEERREAFPPRV